MGKVAEIYIANKQEYVKIDTRVALSLPPHTHTYKHTHTKTHTKTHTYIDTQVAKVERRHSLECKLRGDEKDIILVTGWQRLIGSLIFIGHFPQK